MGLISTEVEVKIGYRNAKYYESLGYDIPKRLNKYGEMKIINGSKITVNVNDLSQGCNSIVETYCDNCGRVKRLRYAEYKTNRIYINGKTYCQKCYAQLFTTKSQNPNWNPNLSDEEREDRRKSEDYRIFIKSVLARDNYTCQCCGREDSDELAVHHLYSFTGYPQYRIDQTQALVLCGNCHKAFHLWQRRKYNNTENKYCTREQYEEWSGDVVGKLYENTNILSTARPIYDVDENLSYSSVKEYCLFHKVSDSKVYDCCNHKVITKYIKKDGNITTTVSNTYTVAGHHLLWLDEYEKMSNQDLENYLKQCTSKINTPVICLTTGKTFNSIKEAEHYYNLSKSGISNCCRGVVKSAGKLNGVWLKWMYLYDFENLPLQEQQRFLNNVKEEL